MEKYYDAENDRIVCLGEPADSGFWDRHWDATALKKRAMAPKRSVVVNTTRRYLPPGKRILEGGCGRADKLYDLHTSGYHAVGVDFAEETVARVNEFMPELDVRVGDVRDLPFEDASFDGYWSLGVIEHFFDGYKAIMEEMRRTIRAGGYLFVSVPSFSVLRKWRARRGAYPVFEDSADARQRFYQFMLSFDAVTGQFESSGFTLCERLHYDGVKGLKDEVAWLHRPLQWCYTSKSRLGKQMKRSVDRLVRNFAGHMELFVFLRER